MSAEVKQVIDELGRAFEEFKHENNQRLIAIEKGDSTADIEAKLAKINEAFDELTAAKDRIEKLENRSNRIGALSGDEAVSEHRSAFDKYITKGDSSELGALQQKAMQTGVDGDGGFAVPEEISRSIMDLLIEVSPIRSIARVIPISTPDYKELVNTRGTTSGWVGETAPRPETDTPTLVEVPIPQGEIYANPAATQHALDDVFFDVENFISVNVAEEFSLQEGAAFVSGNGTNKPSGFLSGATAATADGARAFGTIEHVATGVADNWAATRPHETLVDLIYKMKRGYLPNAHWVTNRGILAEIRKFVDGNGNLIWQPGLQQGQPQMLLGYPVTEAEDMPARAADALSIAFGDFHRGYLITDRIGVRVLRDPLTNKPYIHFYTTKRVGGALVDSEAIKVIKFAVA